MKHSWIVLPLLLALFSCSSEVQNTVDFGYVNSDWTYKNDGINLEFPLPRDWYFLNANTDNLVKIGTDVKQLGSYTTAFQVPISNFKKKNSSFIATLFAITKLDTSSTIV